MSNVSLIDGHIDENINDYIEQKIEILKQLGIGLRSYQRKHLYSLKTEVAVDNYAHDLIVGIMDRDPIH